MKTITVDQLRQNPTAMLADVEAGASYLITRQHLIIARVVPADELAPRPSPPFRGTSR